MKRVKKVSVIFFSIVFILLAALVLLNWDTVKTIYVLNKGSVAQEKYTVQVPFEYEVGLIFINTTVNGVDCRFLLDSGSSNVISTDLAKRLHLQTESKNDVEDSEGNASGYNFTTIDTIGIGELNYLNMGAAIIDLNQSDEIACLNIDGLIGANLMKESIWKIDYQTNTIQITDAISSFVIPSTAERIPIFTELTGSPIVDVIVDQVEEQNVILDLGSNGGFSLSKNTYDSLLENDSEISISTGERLETSVLDNEDAVFTSFYKVLTRKINLGNLEIEGAIVDFADARNTSTIGSKFLENYEVIIDWLNYELILIKKQDFNPSNTPSYGFTYGFNNNNLIVEKLINNASAAKAGLKINDKIIRVDDISLAPVTRNDWCDIVKNGFDFEKNDSVAITILRADKNFTFNLKKEHIFKEE